MSKYTDEQIDAALAVVKEEGDYCGAFDEAVAEAKNADYLQRLRWVATFRNQTKIYDELVAELNKPKHGFKVGDVVRAKEGAKSYFGNDVGGAVGTIKDPYDQDYVRWHGYDLNVNFGQALGTGRRMRPEDLEPWVLVPEVGDYIRAELRNDSRVEFEVGIVEEKVTHFRVWGNQSNLYYISKPNDKETSPNDILSWTLVERPKQWKVGDVVPVGTVVGQEWSGLYEGNDSAILRTVDFQPMDTTHQDRRIVWIEAN